MIDRRKAKKLFIRYHKKWYHDYPNVGKVRIKINYNKRESFYYDILYRLKYDKKWRHFYLPVSLKTWRSVMIV